MDLGDGDRSVDEERHAADLGGRLPLFHCAGNIFREADERKEIVLRQDYEVKAMIFGMTIYKILWYFMIYSVVGWMIEVSYHAVTMGKVVNRGFLNGPLCPVYGSGVLMVLAVLNVIGSTLGVETDLEKASSLLLFAVGIIFATLIELIAGFMLDKLFHARWWDYRDRKFNLNGYICLQFSIIWGLAIAFVLRVIQPFFDRMIDMIPVLLGQILLVIMYLIFIADLIITVMTILKLNKQLERMKNMENAILKLSDVMSEVIANSTLKTVDRIEEGKQKNAVKKEEIRSSLQEARERHNESREEKRRALEAQYEHMKKQLMYHKMFGTGMLLSNFSEHGHSKYQDIIGRIAGEPMGRE
ncbi:MAG: hypothetical protein K6E34_01700 [Lachnospiraceae bacterium]|nr:hypothetical protein [Lachnospiraceae bacterium]